MVAIKKGILSIFLSKVIVGILGLLTVVVLSNYLGTQGRGQISLFLSSVALLQLIIDYGNNTSIINLSYQYNKLNLWKSAFAWILLVSILAQLIVFFIPSFLFLYLVPITALLYSLFNLNNLILMGQQKVNQRNALLITLPLLLLLFFVLLFFVNHQSITAYPLAFILALCVSLLLSVKFVMPFLSPPEGHFEFNKRILSNGFWIQTSQVIQFFNYRFCFFLIAIYIGESQLGIYNNAIVLAESIWILGHSMGQMLHMRILNSDDDNSHWQLTLKFIGINFLGSLLLLLLLIIIPNSFWEFLFSKDFSSMSQLFPYLALGILSFSISNIINHYFHAKNNFKIILFSNLFGFVMGGISAFVLIPQYELLGAAWAWSIGLLGGMLLYLGAFFFVQKKVKKH
jgi:O-antigen/teichoic acid export membrane protein